MSEWTAIERMDREQMTTLQIERLRAQVARLAERVPFYRERLATAGVRADDIRSLDDIRRIPFTRKDDLRALYPFGLLAVPRGEVLRVHSSSGTTGRPTPIYYSKKDLDNWSELMVRTFEVGGVTKDDIIHNACNYGLLTGGLAYHYGAERMGALCVPMSTGNMEKQLLLLVDLGATVLCSTSAFGLELARAVKAAGIPREKLRLKVGFFGREAWTVEIRDEIEAGLHMRALNCYGLSEMTGPGVAVECLEGGGGMHIAEDHFIPEIVDPKTGEPVSPGTVGELVLTNVTKDASPILRYRTRDLSSLDPSPCKCGRTLVRMARISGRTS
jgi:phenylacetate-CoA ligase